MIYVMLLLSIAAMLNGAMDVIEKMYGDSKIKLWVDRKGIKWQNYFDPSMYHDNKWQDGKRINGEDFPGSSTFFVWLTDAWHLFKWLMLICLISIIIILLYTKVTPFFTWYIDFAILFLWWGIVFELTLKVLRK